MTCTGPRPRQPIHGASLAVWSKRKPWRARAYLGGKQRSLDYYASAAEARLAYAAAVRAHLGEAYLRSEDRPG
jgi:hypothetical protein